MRITVVSAHYPPNFVSGGTLEPQRLAQGLQRRGHEVSVYAGWLGEREPLESWTDYDEAGIPIKWIVTTPWVDWSNRRNFDNPDVTTDFRLFLEEVRPDLVHVHSVQSLGAGVVEACAEVDIPVVVTMHDFWWICGRQFLADRAMRPCTPVVSCGMCHCQVNRDWLDERRSYLQTTLHKATQILAVSESSAVVLKANGVGIDRCGPPLLVDENGLPPLPAIGSRRLQGDRVVFVYAGGSEPMKGVHVLMDAAAALAGQDTWELRAYGSEVYVKEHKLSLPGNIIVMPPFRPEQADEVFGTADILVLPSIMRETFSLVTREALARGIPVITSDSFGPEEVVKDGVNGLIVPAGDPAALATAMRSVLENPKLRVALAEGARHRVPIRSLEDQVQDLDDLFQSLVASTAKPKVIPRRKVRRVLFLAGIEGAPLRYRAHFAAEALELFGVTSWIRHYRSPEAPALAALADAVVVYRVPATTQILGLLKSTQESGTPIFCDIDDLIFEPDIAERFSGISNLPVDERQLYMEGVRRYRTTLESCDAFIGSTKMLVDHVAEAVGIPVHRWSNSTGIGVARCSDAALAHQRTDGPLRIGFMSGTKTHDHDWEYVEPAILNVMRSRPTVELWLGGLITPTAALDPFRARVRRLQMKPWWELPWILRDLDVNLAPLAPESQFNEAKSAIKWLEAALVETPTVASSTLPFRESIDDGRTGRLARTQGDFVTAILDLLDDELRRKKMGKAARRDALLQSSPHLQGRRYLDILETGSVGRLHPSDWTNCIALDEPWTDLRFDEYIVPDPMLLSPITEEAPAPMPELSVRTLPTALETVRLEISVARRWLASTAASARARRR